MRDFLRVAWYRFRVGLRRRWPGYFALIAFIAIVGGASLGSIAGARRSESAFPAFLQSTNPSAMAIDVGEYNPKILNEISHLPQVTSIETYVSPNAYPVTKSGAVKLNSPLNQTQFDPLASLNGLFFKQDRFTVLQGRLPNPNQPSQVMVDEFSASLFHWHVGETIRFGFFSNSQLGNSGVPTTPSTRIFNLRITGVGVTNTEIVEDAIDKLPTMILTPALTRQLVSCCISYAWSGVQLRSGNADVPKVESEYLHLLPPGYPYYFHVTSVVEDQAEQAVKPESVALAVFGIIAGLATLLIAFQLMARQVLAAREEREVMWYVGARPWSTATDSLLGLGGSILVGSILAAVVCVGLSRVLIFGPVQSVIPATKFSFDWTVLGLGVLALMLILGGVATLLNVVGAPGIRASRLVRAPQRGSAIAQAATRNGAPIPAVLGLRYALEGGSGRTSVPARSTILGSALAIVVVVGTLTFGSSLNTLISTPKLYGWNWNAMLESDSGYGNVPLKQAAHMLDTDPSVAAWTGIDFDSLLFDGVAVPVIGAKTHAAIGPTLLSGHEVDAPNQVILGPETLAQLHKRVGDTVDVSGGSKSAVLRIVGVATMPTVGIGFGLHLSIGSGALVDENLLPLALQDLIGLPDPGPNAILIRFHSAANSSRALHAIGRIVNSLNTLEQGQAGVISYSNIRPAEITNYQAIGAVPALLAGGLSAGAVAALTLTLLTAVRRRRRDFALLKALGFTRRQLASVLAWQSSVSVTIGMLIGIPVGIVFGRAMWELFAHELFALPRSTVPVFDIVLVALGALVLANAIAAIPGRRAANTRTSVILSAE
jgi:ABC-type antimicrobial peptide transport system permease subunit